MAKKKVTKPKVETKNVSARAQTFDQKIAEIFDQINSDKLFINEESLEYFTNENQAKRSLKEYKVIVRNDYQNLKDIKI